MYQQQYPQYPYGYGYMPGAGYNYGQQIQRQKPTQPITADIAKLLSTKNEALDVHISQEDKYKGWCTHKKPDGSGQVALVENADGTVTCPICGETFELISNEVDQKTIDEICNNTINLLQTIKTIYSDIPEDFVTHYFDTIAMVKKLPNIWKRAVKNFNTYANYNMGGIYPNNPNYNLFSAMNGILNGFNPAPNQYGYQQPMMTPQQPMMAQPQMTQPQQQYMPYGQAPATTPWGAPVSPQYGTAPQIDQYGNIVNPLVANTPGVQAAPPVSSAPQPKAESQQVSTQQTVTI